jgi:hypothetical protein
MRELTSTQIAALERVLAQGFSPLMIPLYPNFIGVRRNACGVLLAPVEGGGFCFFGEACYLIDGNLSVLVRRAEREWFVWKSKQVEATPDLLAERKRFSEELSRLLAPAPCPA